MSKEIISLAQEAGRHLPKVAGAGVPNPAESVVAMFQAWQNYRQLRETEKTKREEIRARTKIEVTRIQEAAQIIREALAAQFAERRVIIDRSFDSFEAACKAGNIQQIEASLTPIISLIKESPLKQAVETVRLIKEREPGQIIDL